jgi:hypothetical protein
MMYYDIMPRYDLDLCTCSTYASPYSLLAYITFRAALLYLSLSLLYITSRLLYIHRIAFTSISFQDGFLYQYPVSIFYSANTCEHSGYYSTNGRSVFTWFGFFAPYNNGMSVFPETVPHHQSSTYLALVT